MSQLKITEGPEGKEREEEESFLIEEKEISYEKGEIFEQSLLGMFLTSLQYIISDIKKKGKTFKIGVATVFLVVAFVAFL